MAKALGWLQRSVLRRTLDVGGYSPVADLLRYLLSQHSYGCAHSSMSRALAGLQAQGLVEIYKSTRGSCTLVALTKSGRERAGRISWVSEEPE
jgi:DNA-binding MarR family transcriptional regulator